MIPIRYTPTLYNDLIQRQLGEARTALRNMESQAITGMKVQEPSDLPTGWHTVHGLRAGIEDQKQYYENTRHADIYLDGAEAALANTADLLKVAHERAVQAASETLGPDERITMAREVEALRVAMLGAANASVGDRFLFAGDAYDASPFDDAGTYTGSTESAEIRIGPTRWLEIGFDGSQVFTGRIDTFQVLDDLATAMRTDDSDGVAALLDDLDTAFDQAVEWRQKLGYLTQDVEDAAEVANSVETLFSERLADHVAADQIETYTELASMRSAYEAALMVSSQSMGQMLFDYLR